MNADSVFIDIAPATEALKLARSNSCVVPTRHTVFITRYFQNMS